MALSRALGALTLQTVGANLPVFPAEYSAVIEVNMPYIPMTMPIRVATSTTAQKMEYYDGLEVDVESKDGIFKFAYNNAERTCMYHKTAGPTQLRSDSDWKPQNLFPDLSEYTQVADELVGGTMCNKFVYKKKHGHTMDDHMSFYWDPVLDKPVRWHQHSRSVPFGSHTDEYIIDYISLQKGSPDADDLIPDSMCKKPTSSPISSRLRTLLASANSYTATSNDEASDVVLQNSKMIEALNKEHAGKASFKANRFVGLTKEEFLQIRGGKVKGSSRARRTAEHKKYVHEHVLSGMELPSDFDWRTAKPGSIGPVKDQAMCGSCWTYGALAPVESAMAIRGRPVLLPEQFVVDCTWTNNTGESAGNFACDGGDSDIGILEIVRKYGGVIPTASAYGSYLSSDGYCKDTKLMETGAKVYGWVDIKNDAKRVEALKDAIFNNGAVNVNIMVPPDMLYFDQGVLDSPQCACKVDEIDHAVASVGYGVADGKPYWTVRNSWSTYWGDQGYILISQQNDCCVASDAGYALVAPAASIVV